MPLPSAFPKVARSARSALRTARREPEAGDDLVEHDQRPRGMGLLDKAVEESRRPRSRRAPGSAATAGVARQGFVHGVEVAEAKVVDQLLDGSRGRGRAK